jgi:hypothetical protein
VTLLALSSFLGSQGYSDRGDVNDEGVINSFYRSNLEVATVEHGDALVEPEVIEAPIDWSTLEVFKFRYAGSALDEGGATGC